MNLKLNLLLITNYMTLDNYLTSLNLGLQLYERGHQGHLTCSVGRACNS